MKVIRISFMMIAFFGCKVSRPNLEEQSLLESAQTTPSINIEQFVEEMKSGLDFVELNAELSSDILVHASKDHSLYIPMACKMTLELGRQGTYKMAVSGKNCSGMEFSIPNTPGLKRVKLFEWQWDIVKKQFKGRTNPEWSSFILNSLSPLIDKFIVPNLPKSIDDISKNFDLGKPELMLSFFWKILGETSDSIENAPNHPLKNVSLRTMSSNYKNLKVKLDGYSLFIPKDSGMEFSAILSGPHRSPKLSSFYFRPGYRAGLISMGVVKKLGALLGSMAVVYIDSIIVESPESYVLKMGLGAGSSDWRFAYKQGHFSYIGTKKPDSEINRLLLNEGKGALEVFRMLLKETRGIFPIILPNDLFQSL